ncbi:MAG: quinol:cytochrome C oxidoreductase [Planctomycetales bacterium]|nr:quinol:cytochrome C oxidoreductase [Planctomycetales bacterium]
MAEQIPNDNVTLPATWRGFAPVLVAVGAVCLLISVGVFYFTVSAGSPAIGFKAFCHSYLANYMYCLSICLGALFFVMVQHLARAGWSASVRRLAELLAFTLPWWAVMFLPILGIVWASGAEETASSAALYSWTVGEGKGLSPVVESKLGFLNPGWFTLRTIVYFGIWILAARLYFTSSRQQDESGDHAITLKLQRLAGPLIMLFSLAVNFAAFDWLMSIDPAWFSTIFGVYLFSASMLSFFATTIFICHMLQRAGRAEKLITVEHYHDLSKFQFGFVVFWGYIAFSQFLLYWYGNIPEETLWYRHRMNHGWQYWGILLIICHFVIPFLGTMSRHVRRNPGLMAFWAVFILVVHWIDFTFLVMPNVSEVPLSPMLIVGHLLCWVGMVTVFAAFFLLRVGETPIVALKDPWLPDALAYHNV